MSYLPANTPDCDDETGCDPVEISIIPRTADIGGYEVRRALPSRKKRMVGPFIFFDQMGPGEFLSGQGLDVRPHPHIGLATVTYLFEGALDHRDSTGVHQTIYPGDVNVMKAGRGVTHSERTGKPQRESGHILSGLQTWLALPKAMEEDQPSFMHETGSNLPTLSEEGKSVRLIMGSCYGLKSAVPTFSDTLYCDVHLEAGSILPIPDEYEERALYVLSGHIEIAGTAYDPLQALILRPGDSITVTAKTPVHLMIFGGAVMDGERYIDWNFVSSSKERLQQAREDWKAQKFDKVPGDDKEFIPLPE